MPSSHAQTPLAKIRPPHPEPEAVTSPETASATGPISTESISMESVEGPSASRQTSQSIPSSTSSPPTSRLSKVLTVMGLAVICVLGWAYATGRLFEDHRARLPAENTAELVRPAGVTVTVEPVTIRPLKRSIEAVGTLFGFEEIVVSAKAEGRIQRIHHDVSDRINPGALLVELDPTDSELAAEQASSNLHVELARLGLQKAADADFSLEQVPMVELAREKRELARLKMERVQSLAQRQATTQEGVDNAVGEFRMAGAEYENQVLVAKSSLATIKARQAALAIAQQQLKDCRVCAPVPQLAVPGKHKDRPYVMTSRSIAEGTFVRVGDEICRLVLDGTLKLRLAVPERHSTEIQTGQHVQVFTAASAEPFDGTVTMINPAVETKTRTFQVEVQVLNDRPGLKPGGFAKAVIEVGEDLQARTIPLSAMVRYAGVIKLFTAENGVCHEVQFTPGIQTSEWIEVASPQLPQDAVVVTSGQFNLAEGTEINIRELKESSLPVEVSQR